MSLRMARRCYWILALVPVFGCMSKDLRTVINEHKARVEPQLAKLPAIRDAARAAPAITNDNVNINGPAPQIGVTDVDERANVAIEYLEDFNDLTAFGYVPDRILGSASMNRCAALLATHRYPYDPIFGKVPDEIPWYVAENNLKHCEVVRYVFVIRSLAYIFPSTPHDSSGPCPSPSGTAQPDAGTSDAGTNAKGKCKVFDGGYFNADVLVFDIKTSTQIGGFRFIAESSPRIDIGSSSDVDTTVQSDFAFKIRAAFTEAAQKHVPSFSVGN